MMHNESPGAFNNLTITVLYDNNPYQEYHDHFIPVGAGAKITLEDLP